MDLLPLFYFQFRFRDRSCKSLCAHLHQLSIVIARPSVINPFYLSINVTPLAGLNSSIKSLVIYLQAGVTPFLPFAYPGTFIKNLNLSTLVPLLSPILSPAIN